MKQINWFKSSLFSYSYKLLEISTWWNNQKCLSLAFFACQIVAKSMKKSLNECSYTLPSSRQAWLIFNKKVNFSISRTIFLTRGHNIFRNKISFLKFIFLQTIKPQTQGAWNWIENKWIENLNKLPWFDEILLYKLLVLLSKTSKESG